MDKLKQAMDEGSNRPALVAELAWRPIETAPKDGAHLLIVRQDGYLGVGYFDADPEFNRNNWIMFGVGFVDPTHWMPLPPVPGSPSIESQVPAAAQEGMAVDAQPDFDAWNMCIRLNGALEAIGDWAHDRSTGPAVWDNLWEIRRMAYEAMETIPEPIGAKLDAAPATTPETP